MTTAELSDQTPSLAIKKLEKTVRATRRERREAKAALYRARADMEITPSHDTLDAVALAQRDYRAKHQQWLKAVDDLEVAQSGGRS